jgi:predicted nuclease of predicted toxin-antitoxin system
MKILVDECLPRRWCGVLREAGYEAVHCLEIAAAGTADRVHFEWAVKNGAVVLTKDLDFGDILAITGAASPSVVIMRSDGDLPEEIGGLVLQTLHGAKDAIEAGALVVAKEGSTRLRVLPLRSVP